MTRPTTGSASIECTFPASAGTGVIPTSVLSVSPAGSGIITIQPTGKTSFAAGAWMVTVIANGQGVVGSATVQESSSGPPGQAGNDDGQDRHLFRATLNMAPDRLCLGGFEPGP